MVYDCERFLWCADLAAGGAQSLERLWRGYLMNEMPIDVQKAGAVFGLVNEVIVPDLVVESGRLCHFSFPDCWTYEALEVAYQVCGLFTRLKPEGKVS